MIRLQLINYPPYYASYFANENNYNQELTHSTNFKIQNIFKTSIYYSAQFLSAFKQSLKLNFVHAKHNFLYLIFDCQNPTSNYSSVSLPSNFYVTLTKVAIWSIRFLCSLTCTTYSLMLKKNSLQSKNIMLSFLCVNENLNERHIHTSSTAIDVSHIPNTVEIEQLLAIFDLINFEDPKNCRYMAPSNLKDDNTVCSREALRTGLMTFIRHVKGKVLFIGVPSSFDMSAVTDFYEQIENSVRYTLHKYQQDLDIFVAQHGQDPNGYSEEGFKQYKNCLENLSRLALTFAIAGLHCGGRYLGDATFVLQSLLDKTPLENQTLETRIHQILAIERLQIVDNLAAIEAKSNPHLKNKYLQEMGSILGLPQTKGIIEALQKDFDLEEHLIQFFKRYTTDHIIKTVQKHIYKEQDLVEQILDWMKDQVKDWKKEYYLEEVSKQTKKIEDYLNKYLANSILVNPIKQFKDFKTFIDLVNYLKETNPQVLAFTNKNWEEFVDTVLYSPAAKESCQNYLLELSEKEKTSPIILRNKIQQSCSEESLGKGIIDLFQNEYQKKSFLNMDLFSDLLLQNQQIDDIYCNIIPMLKPTIRRILNKKTTVEECVHDYYEQCRRNDFLENLLLKNSNNLISDSSNKEFYNLKTEPFQPQLMEWLLVSNNVFLPQYD